ncbi:hypothetical protein [Lysobacter gummosus]|uniref:hypothetical protein n=1 Tax=Lysobacter gummosus TaxID=262324 RepID=UPI003636EF9D
MAAASAATARAARPLRSAPAAANGLALRLRAHCAQTGRHRPHPWVRGPQELHDSIEHPAFTRAQSGRLAAKASRPG